MTRVHNNRIHDFQKNCRNNDKKIEESLIVISCRNVEAMREEKNL
ncbi:hypothetical protein LEP1GSC062_2015 [Leptospira alexanderi serovar Manhao 3 str. L 60]|uniref:Uncharacterized protein n=1 Tax=Leptospira alexanderi serovar Manhao 3 str. L 60 TaxID=1049759 RepID=V6IG20_9LEPT|nr:hypothetical protein LEP1GSC062_2015 [Leptospira alexanderi serovar Manhao 3 str. L 60]